eukprot:CAMPEP_0113683582 /NCGR_PEP_ID=MMETSP0038_2-20120614/13412_1 /TAXON_ID=2898 /ORGANISM="Cryptomonas paramecium" /LENGTH=58 /DNA_ID=CAMNT_0000603005 /DNA_START=572 /DNA_END=748 /DNA_ORIENTATION=+ /assembly_acc=CAM_ASM_000170
MYASAVDADAFARNTPFGFARFARRAGALAGRTCSIAIVRKDLGIAKEPGRPGGRSET